LSATSDNDLNRSLKTNFWDCGYQLTFDLVELLTKYNQKRFLNIYGFTGPSMISYKSTVRRADDKVYMKTSDRSNELALIVGVGLILRIAKPVNLQIEYGRHMTFRDDHLDFSDEFSKNDKISYLSVGIAYKFLARDKDKDGLIDKKDECPDDFGKLELHGCPDADNDGIADKDDNCPTEYGKPELKGCPDKDGDGLADKVDACPEEAGPKELIGCPDKDSDGVADKEDRCPESSGTKLLKGCPDKDGDGVADIDDRCPDIKGIDELKGCPDRDSDGTPDIDDKCPDVAGFASNFGCPEEKKMDLNKIVYFNVGQSIVFPKYVKDLDEVLRILNENTTLKLEIDGHADAVGEDSFNMELSERRSDYVIAFLVKNGIDKNRLTKKYFGESAPASDNNTYEGRSKNRRVEIKTIK